WDKDVRGVHSVLDPVFLGFGNDCGSADIIRLARGVSVSIGRAGDGSAFFNFFFFFRRED
ncbi:MAG: hypothetical protein LBT59_29270, partial [Clostridiales bacterium]|nr:hypothetical protein [Clostridiales bacterium]